MKHIRYLENAEKVARMSNFPRQQVGCVVVYKGKIISTGYNSLKTHPLQKKYNRVRFKEDGSAESLHAEIHALSHIRDADIDWSRVFLYIYRPCRSRRCGMARPCDSCMKFIKEFGIQNIVYSTDDGFAHEKITY